MKSISQNFPKVKKEKETIIKTDNNENVPAAGQI